MHAEGWVLLAQNHGQHLSIDETSLHDDLYTILTNKDGHGRQGTVIAMVRGTKAEDLINVQLQLPREERQKVVEVTMDLSESLAAVRSNR